ncbi:unnamed protein product (mitochondrion) [Plasmodiophora brassicae]|uniref:J domain-containing protein n=1 Tax=Plasmodiophora brassicae TaxID=37360 RepID=A0A0G4J389_PLABS|nr:hypothetical protein PBRA_002310 [Plasmodiophora brassicae]SPQ98900.1 unnamed protein product [Plasmodiophora brassicae]
MLIRRLPRRLLPLSSSARQPFSSLGRVDLSAQRRECRQRHSGGDPFICWKCEHHLKCPVAFCPGCKTIQPPPQKKNVFQILGVEESFDVDLSKLSERYKQMQKSIHPDRFSNATDAEQKISSQYSAELSNAHRTIADPVQRAQALLHIKGVGIGESESVSDPKFLGEVLETRERIESGDPADLDDIRRETVDLLIADQDDFRAAYESGDLSRARDATMRMIYRSNVLSVICKRQPVT